MEEKDININEEENLNEEQVEEEENQEVTAERRRKSHLCHSASHRRHGARH